MPRFTVRGIDENFSPVTLDIDAESIESARQHANTLCQVVNGVTLSTDPGGAEHHAPSEGQVHGAAPDHPPTSPPVQPSKRRPRFIKAGVLFALFIAGSIANYMLGLSDLGSEALQVMVSTAITLPLLLAIIYLILAIFSPEHPDARIARPRPGNSGYDPNYVYFGGLTEVQRHASHAIQDQLRAGGATFTKSDLHPYVTAIRQIDDDSLRAVVDGRVAPDDLLQ